MRLASMRRWTSLTVPTSYPKSVVLKACENCQQKALPAAKPVRTGLATG
jgi:hypothetical protein